MDEKLTQRIKAMQYMVVTHFTNTKTLFLQYIKDLR